MRTMTRVFAFAILLVQSASLAQSDAASTKATVKNFYMAIQRGDAEAIAKTIIINDDPQQELTKAYAQLVLAGKQLADAAKQKFPGASNLLAQGTLAPEDAAKIDAAVVTVEGDTARVKTSVAAEPLLLRRVDGVWRVVVDPGDQSKPNYRMERLALIQGLAEAMKLSAQEITADKYPTVADAESAIKLRLGSVLSKALQADLPTSKPTTRP
jgi:hypothetical protein